MASVPITLGVDVSTEMVVRGGYLKSPVVVRGLKEVEGKKFLYLTKSSVFLSRFLSKDPPRKRPLAKTAIFETIAKIRDSKYRSFLAVAAATGQEVVPSATALVPAGAVVDPCDALGLEEDVPEREVKPEKLSKKRLHKKDKVAVPPVAAVCYDSPGQNSWTFNVLMEAASKSPAIEATSQNLNFLFMLVDDDVSNGHTRRARYGAATASQRPAPRGPPERRSYAVGTKWVTKIREGPEPGDDTPKKLRTLKRRRTGDAGTPPHVPRPRLRAPWPRPCMTNWIAWTSTSECGLVLYCCGVAFLVASGPLSGDRVGWLRACVCPGGGMNRSLSLAACVGGAVRRAAKNI